MIKDVPKSDEFKSNGIAFLNLAWESILSSSTSKNCLLDVEQLNGAGHSELVWKIYKKAADIEIGVPRTLGEFDLTPPKVKAKLAERYGSNVPLSERVVAPSTIYDSPMFEDCLLQIETKFSCDSIGKRALLRFCFNGCQGIKQNYQRHDLTIQQMENLQQP